MTGGRTKSRANLVPPPPLLDDEVDDEQEDEVEENDVPIEPAREVAAGEEIFDLPNELAAEERIDLPIESVGEEKNDLPNEPAGEEVFDVEEEADNSIVVESDEPVDTTPTPRDLLRGLLDKEEFDCAEFYSLLDPKDACLDFSGSNLGQPALEFAAKQMLARETEELDITQVDFSGLMQERELSALPPSLRTSANENAAGEEDLEFARLYVESVFCTQLQAMHEGTTPREIFEWVRQLQVKLDEEQRFFYVDSAHSVRSLFELRPRTEGADAEILFPVAICLLDTSGGDGGGGWRNYLPKDEFWEFAKQFAKKASGLVHQRALLESDLALRPFILALERAKVPTHHLLRQFLSVHDHHDGGAPLVGEEEERASIPAEDMCLPVQLTKRGFQTWDIPECCVYFKDALRLWKALEQFCTHLVFETYSSEMDLTNDAVLHAYFAQVGVMMNVDAPKKRTELARTFSGIVFYATVQRAAIVSPQFVHYAHLQYCRPATAAALLPPFPIAEQEYAPSQVVVAKRTARAYAQSRLDSARFLFMQEAAAFYNPTLYSSANKFTKYCEEFQLEMKKIENNIKLRPTTGYGTRYEWLLPSCIPV